MLVMGWAKREAFDMAARGFGDTGDRSVCLDCVLDPTLRGETAQVLSRWECTFCGHRADEEHDDPIAADFDDFMPIVMAALNFVYETADQALAWDNEDHQYLGGTTTDPSSAAFELCEHDVTDQVLDGITAVIDNDDLWTEDNFARLRGDRALRFRWESFREKVMHRSRFVFLSTPEEHSDHPDEYTTAEFLQKVDQVLATYGTVQTVPTGRKFWRGRLAADEVEARSWNNASELRPPECRDLASNNRMSPAGITMFYGADDIATAIAEIGAHAPQRYAAVGQFETTRDLTLVNLTALPEVPSLYTEAGRRPTRYDLMFLHQFADDLARPIALDGREHINYVPTQIITEYLRYMSTNDVDGILYRSAQNGGVCCVLYCDSSNCLDPGKKPDPFVTQWLTLDPASVHTVRVVASPVQT